MTQYIIKTLWFRFDDRCAGFSLSDLYNISARQRKVILTIGTHHKRCILTAGSYLYRYRILCRNNDRSAGKGMGRDRCDGNDFSIWDLEAEYEIDPEEFVSLGKATTFNGWKVNGRCKATVCDGKVVYKEEV